MFVGTNTKQTMADHGYIQGDVHFHIQEEYGQKTETLKGLGDDFSKVHTNGLQNRQVGDNIWVDGIEYEIVMMSIAIVVPNHFIFTVNVKKIVN